MEAIRQSMREALTLAFSSADTVLRAAEGTMPAQILLDFFQSVRWTEPFIIAILVSHFALWALVLMTRKNEIVHFIVMIMAVAVCAKAQLLNEHGKKYWKSFATQDYFDSGGIFVTVFLLANLVLIANFIVVRIQLQILSAIALTCYSKSLT